MGEEPRKPGQGRAGRDSLEDTIRADPADGAVATRSIPPADRYRLGVELGRGGMGRVVEAYDVQLGRKVALKEALPEGGPSVVRRFVREVQLTARLEHPSIVALYDSGTTVDGRPFYVMRRVSGRPLDELMKQAAGLGERLTLLPALLAAIDAVAHAHRRGVIHRDLKPANILVGELGETVVIDWGLAKVIGEDDVQPGQRIASASDSLRTQLGAVFGTPGFMAPEQARGEELDSRGDVYALGATLYQLLAGAPPHTGTSATEVIEKTGTKAVTSVDVVAPGAPPELVAIVGKALAFDAAQRYGDAGALGEDVRRFLAGQLVAAHRYTRRQRIGRFVRRHRAALAVAALAVAAVAVLAWIGVHRIVEERDVAKAARAAAAEGRVVAERARDEAQRRADQLIVMQARGLVERNPTHAAAVLKELPEGSDRLGEARAVAQAAIVRGAAWTIQASDELTVLAELSADAKFLLQVSRDGMVRVWDLDRRRLVVARPYPKDVRAVWAGSRVLVTSDERAAAMFDPLTGETSELAVGPMRWAAATKRGDRIAYLDGQGAASLLEVATGSAHPLWPGHAVTAIEIAADGSWIALSDKQTVAIVDASGRELTTHPGEAYRLVGSGHGAVGAILAHKLVVCTVLPKPVWTELELTKWQPARPIDLVFRGRELDVYLSSGTVVAWDGALLHELLTLHGLSFRMAVAGRELLIAPGADGQLHFANDLVRGALHLPAALVHLKVLAQPDALRVVALGDGVIVGFELADTIPVHLRRPAGTLATFVDDDTLLLWRSLAGQWQWYDLARGAETAFAYEPLGVPTVIDLDRSDGRVLVRETADDTALVLLHKHTATRELLVRGPSVWGRLLPHGALLFGTGDGRVFAVTAGGAPREVARLEGSVEGAVGLGGSAFAAVSRSGELVRGDLARGGLERARVPGGGFVAAAREGRVLVASGSRLSLWDRGVVEIARLDQQIERIVAIDDGVLVELADHALIRTGLAAGSPQKLLVRASNRSPLISDDGGLVVGQSVNDQLVVIETATGAAWDLPVYYASFELPAIAPSARRFIQSGFGQLALWTLPRAPRELARWLEARTNAVTDRDQTLVWPWQLPRP